MRAAIDAEEPGFAPGFSLRLTGGARLIVDAVSRA
jgi:hypothetical protein